MMKKIMIIIICFMYCCNLSSQKSTTLFTDSILDFIPDTTINNKLFLESYESIDNYFDNKSNFKLVEQLRSSPVAVFSNKNKSEYLLAYQYEGGTKNAFSCFEIGQLKDLETVAEANIVNTEIIGFVTESGLSLGLSIEKAILIKGNSYIEAKENDKKIITYKINKQSDFLQRYSMPGYFLQITFDKTGKINKIFFGFEYP